MTALSVQSMKSTQRLRSVLTLQLARDSIASFGLRYDSISLNKTHEEMGDNRCHSLYVRHSTCDMFSMEICPIGKCVTISSDAADRGFYTRCLSRPKIPYQFTETGDVAVPERLLDAVMSNCS